MDGPWNGKPPPPWDIPCEPEKLFANHVMKIEVPHTAYVTVRILDTFLTIFVSYTTHFSNYHRNEIIRRFLVHSETE